jgi:DNA repair exonuclease SbcCD ATPase subunit
MTRETANIDLIKLGFLFYTLLIKNRIVRGYMANENAAGNPPAGEPNANANQQPQAGNPTTPSAGEDPNKTTYTKEEYERLKKNKHEADNEARNLRERLKALEEKQNKLDADAQTAETERLKKQGEFEKLAGQRETELNEVRPKLETLQTRFDKLAGLTKGRFEADTKDWPKEVKDLLPTGESVDVLELAESIEKYRPLAAKFLSTQSGGGYGRSGTGPPPAGAAQPDLEKARQEHGRQLQNSY